jgi:hypothetical protein
LIVCHFAETKDIKELGSTCKQLKAISSEYLKITKLYLSQLTTLQSYFSIKTPLIVKPLPHCNYTPFLEITDSNKITLSIIANRDKPEKKIGFLLIPHFGNNTFEALKEDNANINWVGRTIYPVQKQAILTMTFWIKSIQATPIGISDPIYIEKVQKAVQVANAFCYKDKTSFFSKTIRPKGIDP